MLGNSTQRLKPSMFFFFIFVARESKLLIVFSKNSGSFVAGILKLSETLCSIFIMDRIQFSLKAAQSLFAETAYF